LNITRIGFLTIGQSPRDDIMSEMKSLLSPDIEVVEFGVLDDLSPEEIDLLVPKAQEVPLVSQLRDGRQALLSEKRISELLSGAIDFMNTKMNVKAVGLLCSHEFSKKKYSCPVIFPAEYMKFIIAEILDVHKLGVVVPLDSQIEMTKRKWGIERTVVVSKSPYVQEKTWNDIADFLFEERVDTVILDCIGFKIQDRNKVYNLLNIPILLPRSVLIYALNQVFCSLY
jgi:protein AroM